MSDALTWGQLKQMVEAKGTRDDTPIDTIDMYSPQAGDEIHITEGGKWLSIQTSDLIHTPQAWQRQLYCLECRENTLADPRLVLLKQGKCLKP